jgi:hypothetical protein
LGGERISRENRTKKYFVRKNKLLRTTTFTATLFIAVILLFSSVIPAAINNNSQNNQVEMIVKKGVDINREEAPLTGLAPGGILSKPANSISSIAPNMELPGNGGNIAPLGRGVTMYGYVAYASGMTNGPCYWDVDTPGTVTKLSDEQVTNFLSGGTWTCDEKWYACQYGTGIIYTVTTDTGHIETVGGGGNGLHGLAFDRTTQTMWACGDTSLFSIDIETGAQTLIAPFSGNGGNTLIGMAFDSDGVLYAWDVKWSGPTNIYTINTETAECTQVADIGVTLTYAQDGDFDTADDDALWLAAYITSPDYGGYLLKVNKDTGEVISKTAFQGSAEIDAAMIQNGCVPPEHDLSLKSIDKPQDGAAYAPVTMQVTVKNNGNNSETTDVQYEIIKCEEGPALFAEDFTYGIPAGWTYSGYYLSYTNKAGGISPEVYYGYTSYVSNGYIMTPPIDVTGFEKVNVKFHLLGDFAGYSGTFFYLQYRKNATSSWRDVSPWANPIEGDLGPEFYTIGCYGWGEPIGEAFQARWYFGNYYYYLQYGSGIYIDDVQFFGCAGCAEYNDLVEDVEVPFDGSVVIDEFAQWTPSEWHNASFQNTWEDYPITAYTTLVDNNMNNNKKTKLLHLYYPWLHNVGTISTEGPEDGPAKTFPVKATVKNTGQYPECCFKAYAEISEFSTGGALPLLSQYFDSSYPPGWTTTHPSNWMYSYSSYAGGSPYEAVFYYYPSQTATFRFMSPAMDTTGLGSAQIDFKHYINHYGGPYTLKVETSQDKVSWATVWEIVDPTSSGQEDVSIMTSDNVGGSTFYVSFTFEGNSYNINYWFIDNVVVTGYPTTAPEYSEYLCISSINPGQEIELTFPNWTPAFLEEGTTGTKMYSFKVFTDMQVPPDNDLSNDAIAKTITLDFFHDVAVEVTSPTLGSGDKLIWDNGDTDGTNGYSIYGAGNRWLLDDFELTKSTKLTEFHCYVIAGTPTDWRLRFREDDGGRPSTEVLETSTKISFSMTATGRYWFGYAEYKLVYKFDPIKLSKGIYWVEWSCSPSDGNMFCMIRMDYQLSPCWANYGDQAGLQEGSYYFGVDADMSFELWGSGGASVYIPLSTQSIDGIGENFGTFPEYGMTCYADIYELYTNCEEGTLVQSYQIDNIDILTPLTGTKPLPFGTYNFAVEGPYELKLNLVNANDDYPDNNIFSWAIGADGTPPTSEHVLSPAAPDGDNGWYVSDLTVTLNAADPSIGCDQDGAGVKEIKYTINGVSGSVPGDTGSFKIENDGNDIEVKYWAIDNVGNEEAKHTFKIDMDQTKPDIPESIAYTTEKKGALWYATFSVTCVDATSGMNRVEWALNDVVQNITTGSGPIYTWTIQWSADLHKPTITFKATAYDEAGNNDAVTISGADITSSLISNNAQPSNNQQSQQSQTVQKITTK